MQEHINIDGFIKDWEIANILIDLKRIEIRKKLDINIKIRNWAEANKYENVELGLKMAQEMIDKKFNKNKNLW